MSITVLRVFNFLLALFLIGCLVPMTKLMVECVRARDADNIVAGGVVMTLYGSGAALLLYAAMVLK